MENFVRKNIEMFLKENFVVNLDFLRRNLKLIQILRRTFIIVKTDGEDQGYFYLTKVFMCTQR